MVIGEEMIGVSPFFIKARKKCKCVRALGSYSSEFGEWRSSMKVGKLHPITKIFEIDQVSFFFGICKNPFIKAGKCIATCLMLIGFECRDSWVFHCQNMVVIKMEKHGILEELKVQIIY